MNRKELLALVRQNGYTGAADPVAIKAWTVNPEDPVAIKDAAGNAVDIDKAWSDHSPKVIKAAREIEADPGDEDTGEADTKAAQPRKRAPSAAEVVKAIGGEGKSTLTAKNWANIAKRKAYDAAAARGDTYRGAKCVFSDADRAEYATAALRLTVFGDERGEVGKAYATQKAFDEEIVGKSGSVGALTAYGYSVIEEFMPELIELFPTFGAARQAASVTPMSGDTLWCTKWGTDVTMYDVGESDTITASDGAIGRVQLVATKTAALVKNSREILNDSALDLSNILARSIARAVAKWEDESYFNGSHNRAGLLSKIDANSTYDAGAAGSLTDWGGYTTQLLQNWKAKLAGWALEDPDLAIVCHPAFYESVLKVRAYSAGGTPGEALLRGIPIRAWDGVPVIFSHVMPSTYVADQISAYIGSFGRATKFGVVRGSENMATSDQRYFETDEVAMRFTQRWAINCHEVSGTNTGVMALKD